MLVLKDIPGGSLKISPENSNNLARPKIASKGSWGICGTPIFETFSAFFLGPKGPRDLCKGQAGSQLLHLALGYFVRASTTGACPTLACCNGRQVPKSVPAHG